MVQGVYSNLFAVPKPKQGIRPIFNFIPTETTLKQPCVEGNVHKGSVRQHISNCPDYRFESLNLQKSLLEPTHRLKYLILALDLF